MRAVKGRTDKRLFCIFLLSMAIYVVIFATCFVELPVNRPPWHIALLFYFHSIPMFCLQLLLCRLAKLRWRLLVPLAPIVLIGVVVLSVVPWDLLGCVLYLVWCAAPVLGCVLAWAVWAVERLVKRWRRDTRQTPG